MPHISKKNSSSTPLNANQTFAGTSEKSISYGGIVITVVSDVNSVDMGVKVYFSSDNKNWVKKGSYTYQTNYPFDIQLPIVNNYCKVIYTNSDTDQTHFSLQTMFLETILRLSPTYHGVLYDSVHRKRVSSPHSILDVTHTYDKNNLMIAEKITGTATSVYQVNQKSILMSVSTTNDNVIRQSRQYVNHHPDKSLLIFATGILNANDNHDSVTTKIGFFDNNNGIFFQYAGGVLSLVERSYASGSVVDTVVNNSEWNLDKMIGVCMSGITLDITKIQKYVIDLSSLSMGRIRCGIVARGQIWYAHEFLHSNRFDVVFTSTTNLPVRYEITSNDSEATGKLLMLSASILSEGKYNPHMKYFGISTGETIQTIFKENETPLITIRLRSDRNRTIIKPNTLQIHSTEKVWIFYRLRLYFGCCSPPFSSQPAYTKILDNATKGMSSAVEYTTSQDNFITTDSIILCSGYTNNSITIKCSDVNEYNNNWKLTSNIDGVSDYLVLTVMTMGVGSNKNGVATMSWIEIN
jgi:hypothetical protein